MNLDGEGRYSYDDENKHEYEYFKYTTTVDKYPQSPDEKWIWIFQGERNSKHLEDKRLRDDILGDDVKQRKQTFYSTFFPHSLGTAFHAGVAISNPIKRNRNSYTFS